MIPKYIALVFMWCPLIALGMVRFLFEPHMYVHITQHQDWIMRGEGQAVLELGLFYLIITITILLWKNHRDHI